MCFRFNSFCIHSKQEVFMLNLEYDYAWIRSRYDSYAVIGKWFWECSCYDMLCHKIFQIMSTPLFNLTWKEILCFIKNYLIKPMWMRLNRGMFLIRNHYVETFSIRFTSILTGLWVGKIVLWTGLVFWLLLCLIRKTNWSTFVTPVKSDYNSLPNEWFWPKSKQSCLPNLQ